MVGSWIQNKFWTDSYIQDLDSDGKLLYIYLLTNLHTHFSGIYEISLKTVQNETDISRDKIDQIMNKLENDNKIIRKDQYIILINFIKNQLLNKNQLKGVYDYIQKLPDKVKVIVFENDAIMCQISKNDKITNSLITKDLNPSEPLETLPNHSEPLPKPLKGLQKNGIDIDIDIDKEKKHTKKESQSDHDNVEPEGSVESDDSVVFGNVAHDEKDPSDDGLKKPALNIPVSHSMQPYPSKSINDISTFFVISEMLAVGIQRSQVLKLYNENSVLNLTRWWLWSIEKAKTNNVGLFLTLVNKKAEMPEPVADKIRPRVQELNELEHLIEEQARRKHE